MLAALQAELIRGVGTTVHVRLPYAAVDEKGARVAPGEAKIIPFKGAA